MQYNERFTVNIDMETRDALNALAARSGMSAAALARQALWNFLANPVISLPAAHVVNKRFTVLEHSDAGK